MSAGRHHNSAHNVVSTFKPSPKPQGRCQNTITVRNDAGRLVPRVCNTPCKGQLCDDCKAHTEAVAKRYSGAGMMIKQMDRW